MKQLERFLEWGGTKKEIVLLAVSAAALLASIAFGSVLVRKKNQIHSAAAEALIAFSKQYIKGISEHMI